MKPDAMMKMSVFLALIALALATVSSLAPSGGAGPVVSSHVVEIRHLRFRPAQLTLAAGDTVVWINRDIVPHTIAGVDAGWSSGELAHGGSWRWVPGTEGRVPYYCEYHPTMRGSLVVRRAADTRD